MQEADSAAESEPVGLSRDFAVKVLRLCDRIPEAEGLC